MDEMSTRAKYIQTEQAALQEEQEERELQQELALHMDEYIGQMNRLLEIGTVESRFQIRDMFLDSSFLENYKQLDLFATMYVVMSIYEEEYAVGIESTILEQGKSMQDFYDYYFELKMLIYRMDFDFSEDTEQKFVTFLRERNVSTIALRFWFNATSMRSQQLALKLMEVFERRKMYSYLIMILGYIEDKWSGSYNVLLKLAEIYSALGREENASLHISKIPVEFMELYEKNHQLVKLQELLWRVCHEDENAEIDLILFLKEHDISKTEWSLVVDKMKNEKNEACLCLLETLLDGQLKDRV